MSSLQESSAAFDAAKLKIMAMVDKVAPFGFAGKVKADITDDMIQEISDAALDAAEAVRGK